jgi:5-formyltetrahydrofolate cyclo-ligase
MPLSFENQLPSALVTQSDKDFAIPKVLNAQEMIFTAYHSDVTMESSTLGVLEATDSEQVFPDLIIVPALAWRKDGYRIGFGKGYYDRYLTQHPTQTIGLAFDFQVIDFEVEAHDKKVDLLIQYETKTQ